MSSAPDAPSAAPVACLVELRGVTKAFGQAGSPGYVLANDRVDLAIRPGEVHALLGENGAGKSTLMSILSGRLAPDAGEILVRGEGVAFASPRDGLRAGIGMVYQRFALITQLSVRENLRLAAPALSSKKLDNAVAKLERDYGLALSLNARVADLAMGARQRLEIVKLLLLNAEVLIFDEPTAVLTPPEVEAFFTIVRTLTAQGKAVVFITHKLEEVLALSERISILRRGRMVASMATATLAGRLSSKRELARLMVGREVVLKVEKETVDPGEAVLEASGLAGRTFSGVDLRVRRGEIVAVIGVAGNGQEELAACLGGLSRFLDGTVTFAGEALEARRFPSALPEAARQKLAYVPEDRDRTGSVVAMDLRENYLLTNLNRFVQDSGLSSLLGLVDYPAVGQATREAMERFAVVAPSARTLAGSLSGGNLQKLLLARELAREPALLIAEQPTQGLDIAATEDVWSALIALRETAGVLLITGDTREALSLADVIHVFFRGRILASLDPADEEAVSRIGLTMAGVATSPEAAHDH